MQHRRLTRRASHRARQVAERPLPRTLGYARWRIGRIHRSLADAAQVRERRAYLRREIKRRPSTGRYLLKDGRASVVLRHHTDDTGVFAEIFRRGYYKLPKSVTDDLRSLGTRASFVDLGANVGLFAAWVLSHFPDAHLTAFEPDPASLKSLREVIRINGVADAWTIIPACASNHEGNVAFAATGTSVSRMTARGSPDATMELPLVDVFDYLDGVDVLKMDIEGAEWSILLDARWPSVSARAVLMEYHPHGCPGPDARELALQMLRNAGYVVESLIHHTAGHGMLRAIRN